jgi:predicted amidohydrolase YtcJ
VPAQKIAVEDAIRAYTIGGAYASFEEGRKGALTVGRVADFVVIDRNLFGIPPEEIGAARVALTVAGGRVVHDAAH